MAKKKTRSYICVNVTNKDGWGKMFDCKELRCEADGTVTLVLLDGGVEVMNVNDYRYFSPFIYTEEKEEVKNDE